MIEYEDAGHNTVSVVIWVDSDFRWYFPFFVIDVSAVYCVHKDSLYRTAIVMKVIKSDIQWKDTLKNNIYLKDSVKRQEVSN